MKRAPLPPEWLTLDPYPDGPHWANCARTHPGCAWREGVRHGQSVAANFILNLAQPGDGPERARALAEAAQLVSRLAGIDTNGDPMKRVRLTDAEIAAIEEAAADQLDREALAGACMDEAAANGW